VAGNTVRMDEWFWGSLCASYCSLLDGIHVTNSDAFSIFFFFSLISILFRNRSSVTLECEHDLCVSLTKKILNGKYYIEVSFLFSN